MSPPAKVWGVGRRDGPLCARGHDNRRRGRQRGKTTSWC